jgi:hypothetical protein
MKDGYTRRFAGCHLILPSGLGVIETMTFKKRASSENIFSLFLGSVGAVVFLGGFREEGFREFAKIFPFFLCPKPPAYPTPPFSDGRRDGDKISAICRSDALERVAVGPYPVLSFPDLLAGIIPGNCNALLTGVNGDVTPDC